jgi:ribonuclease P protein component
MTVRWLKSSDEFQVVYKTGKRFDSRYMTVFALQNEIETDRFGLTASRRVAKKAVDRNRMKRLLREAVRSFSSENSEVAIARYDFVINAKRSLLAVKMPIPSAELALILLSATKRKTV